MSVLYSKSDPDVQDDETAFTKVEQSDPDIENGKVKDGVNQPELKENKTILENDGNDGEVRLKSDDLGKSKSERILTLEKDASYLPTPPRQR
eukprot:Pgem_evm1s13398